MVTPRRIVLLARAPSAHGKSRLTQHLDQQRALELRRALLLDTLDAAAATGIPCAISYTPDDARDEIVDLTSNAAAFPQRGDSLGDRMRNAMADAFTAGARTVVLIGSDLPALPPEYLVRAFERLEEQNVEPDSSGPAVAAADAQPQLVLGPTSDGGFYLIGSRTPVADVFRGVDWDGRHVLDAVTSRARDRGYAVSVLPAWWDVDVPEDLQRVRECSQPHAARRVRKWLAA